MQNRNREQASFNDGRMNGYADEKISSNMAIRLPENYFAYNPRPSNSAGGRFPVANAGEIGLRFNEGVTDEDRKRFAIADESGVDWLARQSMNGQKSILSATAGWGANMINGSVEIFDAIGRSTRRLGREHFGDSFDYFAVPAGILFESSIFPSGAAGRQIGEGLHLLSEFFAVPEDEQNLWTQSIYAGTQAGLDILATVYIPSSKGQVLFNVFSSGARNADDMARRVRNDSASQESKDQAILLAGGSGALFGLVDGGALTNRMLGEMSASWRKEIAEYLLNSSINAGLGFGQEYHNFEIQRLTTNPYVTFDWWKSLDDATNNALVATLVGRIHASNFQSSNRADFTSLDSRVSAEHLGTDSQTLLHGIPDSSGGSVTEAATTDRSVSTGGVDGAQVNPRDNIVRRARTHDDSNADIANVQSQDDAQLGLQQELADGVKGEPQSQIEQGRVQEGHQEDGIQAETYSDVQAEQVTRHEGDDRLVAGDDANVLSDDVQRVQELQDLQEPSDVIEVDAARTNEERGEVNHVEGSELGHRVPEDKPVATQAQELQGGNGLTRRVRDAVDLVKRFNPLQRVDALLRMNRRERRIRVAEEQGRKFDALHEAAVRARADEGSDQKAWLDELVAERGGEFIYIDKDALEASGVREQVEEAFPLVAGQMQRQGEHGLNIPIMINLGSYARNFAHTDAAKALADHLRFSADSDSRAQVRALRENAQKLLIGDILSIDQNFGYARDRQLAAERVHADILRRLNGFKELNELQRVTAARLMSSFYVRLAQRNSGHGKIWEFYERNSLFGEDSAQRLTDFESELTALISQSNGKVDVAGVVDATGRAFLSLYTRVAYDTRNGSLGSINQDVQVLLDYMGVKDIDAWQGMSNEQRVVYENKFLDAFGVYLQEGRAHSPGLLRSFRTLKTWLKDVFYSRFSGNGLPGEVREVLERMFYSDDLLQMQYSEAELDAFVRAAQRAGVDVDLAEYALHLGADARDSAAEIVQNALWRDEQLMLRLQSESGFQAERGTLMNELQRELSRLPVFGVIDLLTRQEGGVKFSAAALEALLGVDGKADFNSLRARGMVADVGGVSPEVLADEQGASSAYELVREVLRTKPLDEVVPALADAMLKAKYGEVSTPEKIQQVAQEALFNSLPHDALDAAELRILEQLSGVKVQSAAYLEQQVHAMVDGADIGMIDSAYFRNEMRDANRAASHALDGKDYVAASQLYDKARLLRRAMQEVLTARRQIDEQLRDINIWVNDGAIEPQTRGVIQDLVVQHGLVRRSSRRNGNGLWDRVKKPGNRKTVAGKHSLERWRAAVQDNGVEVNISEVDFAALDNEVVTAMTQEQLTRVYEMIEQIALIGRRLNEAHPGEKVLRINAVRNKRPQRRIRGDK